MQQRLAGAHLRAAAKRAGAQQPALFKLEAEMIKPIPLSSPPAVEAMEFFVPGIPAPGGSKSFIPLWRRGGELITVVRNGRVWPVIRVVDSADVGTNRVSKWKNVVRGYAGEFMCGARPYQCPVRVELVFFMPRPQFHLGTGKNAGFVKESAPRFHTVKPDALKLARSTEDALTGIVFDDDAGNVSIQSEKCWCNYGEQSGVLIRIKRL